MNALLSSSLLAASLLLGQADQPNELQLTQGRIVVQDAAPTPLRPLQGQPAPMQSAPPQRPILGWFQREERPILSKMQNWFKRDQHDKDGSFNPARPGVIRETAPPPMIAPPANDFPRKLPNSQSSQGPLKVQPTSLTKEPAPQPLKLEQPNPQPGVAPKAGKSPIHAKFTQKIGRDDKFEWITGQLEMENNNYVIYYATPETIDKYHGRLVLVAQQNELSALRKGDLVSLRGQLMQRQTAQGMVPIYRVEQANLVERPR